MTQGHEGHEHVLPPTRRAWGMPGLLMSAVFLLSGAIIGGTVTFLMIYEPERFGPPVPGEMPAKIVRKLRGDLALDESQAKQIQEIFVRGEREMDVIREKLAPEMDAHRAKLEEEVAALLRPEQLEAWREKCLEMKERFEARRPCK